MPKASSIPVAVSVFPDELYPAPRSWAERAFPKLIHYNKLDKGGHFAAGNSRNSFRRASRGLQITAVRVEKSDVIWRRLANCSEKQQESFEVEALLFRLRQSIARPQTWTTQGAVAWLVRRTG